MKTELILKFVFEASHSLSGYEVPHPHIWKLKIGVLGDPVQGMILNLVELRASVQKTVDRLGGTYLNESTLVDDAVRAFPTCETLSVYFYREVEKILSHEFRPSHPSVRLSFIEMALFDMNQNEFGATRLTL